MHRHEGAEKALKKLGVSAKTESIVKKCFRTPKHLNVEYSL